ncbi:hypothetical protein JIN84_21970 [Luteolibacter yonseiensis]|uniref:Transporter n=1 Tax=Luteolibacter yonseiensis TaxID=1144680 RepID=A0A934VCF9_9BACT|nr:hypothetical protein [Luteolibacter yonseiensis]MBK1818303.1 hypothetical protein [Luteolibacter yonseiensis]
MKQHIITAGVLGLLSSFVFAGSVASDTTSAVPAASGDGFARARRPISNPTLFDLALPATNVHPLFLYHSLPKNINTTLGKLPLGGDVELYALQFEIALNDRLSVVATKDGYVDVNPDSTASGETGFANLGGGLKYAFILDPVSQTALSGTVTLELPTGNSDVFQGEGDGLINLSLSGLKLIDDWQFSVGTGVQIPFSDEQSSELWTSAHASYEISRYFIPLVELNWFHVLDSGNGAGNYPTHVGGSVPAVIEFEGGDLFNLGAANSDASRDFVSTAVGFRSRLTESVDAGVAYEIPLTDDEDSLMKSRWTVDLVWSF